MSADQPSEVDVLAALAHDLCSGVRTSLAGIVVAYNPATRTAKVQPARRGRANGQAFDLPIIPDAPVLWRRFAGIVEVGRLNPGDPVLIIVADRELDAFLANPVAAPYDPKNPRCHDLTDALVLPAFSPTASPLTVGDGGASFYLGREDGTAGLSIPFDIPGLIELDALPAGIRLGATAVEPTVKATTLNAALAAYGVTIATAFATWLTATGGPPAFAAATPIINAALLNAIGTATATLVGLAATWVTSKVIVE